MTIIVLVALQKSQMEKTFSAVHSSIPQLSSHIPRQASIADSLPMESHAHSGVRAARGPSASETTLGQHSEDDTQLGAAESEATPKMPN